MPRPIRKRKRAQVWRVIITVFLVTLVVLYICYQAYRSLYSEIHTELATVHSVYESIEAEGLVYRAETLIPAAESGTPYFAIENGTHVAKKSVIASVYEDSESGRIEQEIMEIDEQIRALKTIVADAGSGRLTLNVINNQFSDALLQLIHETETGDLSQMSDFSFNILSLLSKKSLITGKEVDFTAKIQELEAKKTALKEAYSAPVSSITAPDAGYFANSTDGFETLFTTDHIQVQDLTTDILRDHMNQKPTAVDACGKIVKGYEWYLACIVPDSYYNVLGKDVILSIRLPFVMDEAIPVKVETAKKDNKGQMVVVFRCDQMSAALATIRMESVEIRLVEHTGMKVPKRAIVVKDKETGVFIRSGNVVAFRKIKQSYSQPADYVICEMVEDDGYLQMYDDIIVGGRDLYDGKIIR